jgi:hypothetical protein
MPSVDVLLREKELAEYNAHMKRRMEACQQRIDAHKRTIKQLKAEKDAIEKEWHAATTLPRLFGYHDDGDDFWRRWVPSHVKYDPDLAGLLLRCCRRRRGSDPLPVQFLKMLWTDPQCPLRQNRDLLVATLGRFGARDVQIVFSPEMAKDRDLVRACFAHCPQALQADDGNGNGGVPLSYLRDMDMLRALAFSDQSRYYRSDHCDIRKGIHHHFAKDMWHDPAFLADLLVYMMRRANFYDRLAHDVVDKAFPEKGIAWEQQPLLDDEDFAVRVAAGMAGFPYPPESRGYRERWPVTYRMLSPRLQQVPDVALAFVRAWGSTVLDVPQSLCRNEAVWFELWKAATNTHPPVVYSKSLDAKLRSTLLSSKELVLRLVSEVSNEAGTAGPKAKSLGKFAGLVSKLPTEIKADREINVQLVLLGATTKSTKLHRHVAPEWLHNREFWLHLAEEHHCPCSTWGLVSADVARDAAVVQAWARHASSEGRIDWIANVVDRFPDLDLLSDRHVLLNLMPELYTDNPRAEELFRRISPDVRADKSLWLELLSKGGSHDYLAHMPEGLRQDDDVVDARLRSSGSHNFPDRYLTLPVDLQQRFAHRLVEAIQKCDSTTFDDEWGGIYTNRDLMRLPEVAYASMAKGWRRFSDAFRDTVRGLPWRDDPDFLLAVARDPPKVGSEEELFWSCCSSRLRRDKEFMMRALEVGKKFYQLERWFDNDLQKDFDIRCAVFLRDTERSCTRNFTPDHALAREARRRLALYVSLETFMEGVKSVRRPRHNQQHERSLEEQRRDRATAPTSPAAALTILNQDGFTLAALKGRLRELLGAPSGDHAAVVRKVANVFTRNGY